MLVMHRFLVTIVLAVVAGCDDNSRGNRETDSGPAQHEELATLLDSRLDAALDAALDERLAPIETSLEQIQLRLELLAEELKTAQIQQARLAAFELEIKQALVDLGNVMRRAISSQRARDPADRRP
jgi:hypothetical protein